MSSKEVKFLLKVMEFPVTNLLGMYLYLLIFIMVAGVLTSSILFFIPKKISFAFSNSIVGLSVCIAIILWWFVIF